MTLTPPPDQPAYGLINFTLPASSHADSSEPLQSCTWLTEAHRVPLRDAKADLDFAVAVREQLAEKGWAVARHTSAWADSIPEGREEGLRGYYRECADVVKAALGADRVLIWNSTTRFFSTSAADSSSPVSSHPSPPPDISSPGPQPPADFAHVDQSPAWGAEMVRRASGRPPSDYGRSMILNLWRPLGGKVTARPLVMLDYRSMPLGAGAGSPSGSWVVPHPGPYGTGLRVLFHPDMRWSYVRHQTPGEIVLLKCWDSSCLHGEAAGGAEVTSRREAAFGAHAAADVGEADLVDGKGGRESVEVRMILLWEHRHTRDLMHHDGS